MTHGTRLWIGLLGSLLALCAGFASGEDAPSREYQIKAAFLYNFAKFVGWPAHAFKEARSTMTLCVLGSDPFGAALDQAIAGKTVAGRKMVVARFEGLPHLDVCHILFISPSERDRLAQILDTLTGSSVLTVGDTERFAHQGGMINFYVDENKVRFEINERAAERAGLKISSKLLKLATIVPDTSGK